MYEDLELDAGFVCRFGDLFHIIERKFAGEDHTRDPVFRGEPDTGRVMDGHLRACMEGKIRHDLSREREDADILHEDRVNADIGEEPKILGDRRHIVIVCERVDGHIDFDAVLMGEYDGIFQLFVGKVRGILACPEKFSAEIYSIRAGIDGSFQSIGRTRRR